MAGKKTVWDLALEITGDDKNASSALKKVKSNILDVQAAGKRLGNDFKSFTGNVTKLALGAGGGIAAVTAGVIAMANSFAATGDKVAKTSAAVGIGIEAYQGLSYAMEQSGLSAEEFDGALQKFNLTVKQGAAGNDAARKQLEDIGLSARKLAGMKPEQAIERLSDYMNSLPNDAARTRAAVTLFGKTAGPKMMAAMKQGSAGLKDLMKEAKSLGIVMTEEQARQSEAYGSAINSLKKSVTGMRNQFIGSAIGPLTQAFDHLKDAIVDQMPAIQELGMKFGVWLGDMVKRLPEIIAKIKEFAANVWDNVNKVKDFLGGWKNVAKVVAALAIAPSFISGIKVVVSLASLLKTVITGVSVVTKLFGVTSAVAGASAAAGGAAGAAGFGALAVAVWASIGPILAVIAAIAGVIAIIVFVVKNFDKIKEVAGKAWGAVKEGATKAWGAVKEGASKAWEGIKAGASKAGGFLKNNWKSIAVGMVNPIAGGLHALYKNHEGFRNLVDGVWGGIKNTAGKAWEGIKGTAGKAWAGMKNASANAADFFKNRWADMKEAGGKAFNFLDNFSGGALTRMKDNFFNGINNIKEFFAGLWSALKEGPAATFEYIKNAFVSLITGLKEKLLSFVNFFKDKLDAVKNFFGGIGDKIGGAFNKGKTKLPGHAEGGIFTQRHIAEIAERGAEAVVPLNNSPQGLGIWEKAGEMGGYLNKDKTRTETSPVMSAAAGKLSGSSDVYNFDVKMTNNFNGGTPDTSVVNQLASVGKQAADDFESKVAAAMEKIRRQKERVSYA